MRLLVFSDLHRDRDAARSLVERSGEADLLIGAGDFAVVRHGIDDVIEILREVDKPTVLVPGNGESDVELREACAGWGSAHVLHGEGVTLEGVPLLRDRRRYSGDAIRSVELRSNRRRSG